MTTLARTGGPLGQTIRLGAGLVVLGLCLGLVAMWAERTSIDGRGRHFSARRRPKRFGNRGVRWADR